MQWEYKTLKIATKGFMGGKLDETQFENYLNELGQQQWELVTAFDTNKELGETRDVVAIFKRPL